MAKSLPVTGREIILDDNELIVSKTDKTGRITYCNKYFISISGYSEKELIGAPHSILRHPDMPRCVFKLLWDTIENGLEIFAYVINRCKNGDHYWVLAHVTPSFGGGDQIIGYHSNRRAVDRQLVRSKIEPLYKQLRDEEARHHDRKDGLQAGERMVAEILQKQNLSYEEFVARL